MKKLLMATIPALLIGSVSAAPKLSAQSIIVNPVQSDLTVRVWTDRDPSGNGTPAYNRGDKIQLYVTPSRDAYVYLFNVDPSGQIIQILPNRFSGAAFIKANTVQAFPGTNAKFTFDIAGQNGVNKVLALASRTPLNLSQLSSFKSAQDTFATVTVRGQEGLAQALSIVVTPVQDNAWVTDTAQYAVNGRVAQPAPAPLPAPLPAWTTQNNWNSTFTSNTENLDSVYTRYSNELQSQGYRLIRSERRGNHFTAQFQGRSRSTAELSVKQEGRSGRFEVKITRRN
ncbi:DUF4384 domain-containing protein [Deinococcus ruber]|uniref:S-layer protein n=1 Tax=Deinococcus ruber TaxID=1848197 RepID=A0A918C1E6_9DEIO|nr:DUF4384 domain-containing protein [Deinococcus ruber]GGR02352.1 S-layer protein [Deinococcus ruber]